MGKLDLTMNQVKSLPVFFGEVDIMKTLQQLPGVSNAGEGNTGLYVRGGGPDQNLIHLDDAVVYNTGHLFGFFSIFNADASELPRSKPKGHLKYSVGSRLWYIDGSIVISVHQQTAFGAVMRALVNFLFYQPSAVTTC